MKTVLFASAGLSALLLASSALAQTAATPDVAGRGSDISDVVVTATRSPQALNRIGASVTVLDEADIREDQSINLVDLIAKTPAISVARNGGPGGVTSVYVRGAESYHTVVVIDGVRLTDPATTRGGASFENLLVGDAARVEILRGAQSTLWGSQAIGGVVNIVTAEPTAPFEADGSLEIGTGNTAYARLGVGGAGDRISWRTAASGYTTNGFSVARSGTEKDGYDNLGLSGRLNARLTDILSLDLRAAWSDASIDFDGFDMAPPYAFTDTAEYGRTRELVSYAGVNADLLGGRLKNRLGYSYTETTVRNYDPNPAAFTPLTFESDGEVRRVEYQGSLAIADGWTAGFGAEREHARIRYNSQFSTAPLYARTGSDAVYAQVQGDVLPDLTVTAGARYEDNDTYGGDTVGQVAAAWRLGETTILRASWSQGFRAPGLYELYSEYGNTDLKPEAVDSYDLGVTRTFAGGRLTASATAFRRDVDNQITFFDCFSGSSPLCAPGGTPRFGFYENTLKTRARGLELEGELKASDSLTLSANYTWTDAVNASGPSAGNRLPRRPENLANVTASWAWASGLSTSVAARYVGKSFTSDFNTVSTDPYTLVDLRASYPLPGGLELYGRVENLFDEDYETVPDYGVPGRSAIVGIRARF
jgi:vitamin B12 transporter